MTDPRIDHEDSKMIKFNPGIDVTQILAELTAAGKSPQEIAEILELTSTEVLNTQYSGDFQRRIDKIAEYNPQVVGNNIIRGQIIPSLIALADVRDSPKTNPSAKIAAAKAFLEMAKLLPPGTERLDSAILSSDPHEVVRQIQERKRALQTMLSDDDLQTGPVLRIFTERRVNSLED